jgi:hypothetical protein
LSSPSAFLVKASSLLSAILAFFSSSSDRRALLTRQAAGGYSLLTARRRIALLPRKADSTPYSGGGYSLLGRRILLTREADIYSLLGGGGCSILLPREVEVEADTDDNVRGWVMCEERGKWRMLQVGVTSYHGRFSCNMNNWSSALQSLPGHQILPTIIAHCTAALEPDADAE